MAADAGVPLGAPTALPASAVGKRPAKMPAVLVEQEPARIPTLPVEQEPARMPALPVELLECGDRISATAGSPASAKDFRAHSS